MTTIRRERPADFTAIDAVLRAAFDSAAEANLVRAIRQDACYRPEFAFVASAGADIVGHVMLDGCWVRSSAGDQPVLMLSPLAVAPDYQRRGIGAALIEAAIAAAAPTKAPFVVLEGSPEYYRARGFRCAGDVGLTLPLPDWAPRAAAQVRLLPAYRPTDPTLRGEIIYPPPFADLD